MAKTKEKMLLDAKIRLHRLGYEADMFKKVKIKMSDGRIYELSHEVSYITIIDQISEAGEKLTSGTDVAPLYDEGDVIPIEDIKEVSIKLKGVNYNMYLYLLDLYTQIENVDINLPDEQYQQELDSIQWEFDIEQIFDYPLQY